MWRYVVGGITLFWLVMTGWLIRREILPEIFRADPATYAGQLDRDTLPPGTRYGIYHAGRRVGVTETVYLPDVEGGIEIRTVTRTFPIAAGSPELGEVAGPVRQVLLLLFQGELEIQFDVHLNTEKRLERFEARLEGLGIPLRVDGECVGDQLLLESRIGGRSDKARIEFRSEGVIDNGFGRLWVPEGIRIGDRWEVFQWDPFRRETRPVEILVRDVETIPWEGGEERVYRLWIGPNAEIGQAWVRPEDGLLLQQEIQIPVVGVRLELRYEGEIAADPDGSTGAPDGPGR